MNSHENDISAQALQENSHHKNGLSSYLHIQEEVPRINAPVLGDVGFLSIATSTVTIMLITIGFLFLCRYTARLKMIPTKMQHLLEMFYEQLATFITSIVGDKERARIIIPYVGAIFMYLLVANLLFFLPFLSSFYIEIGGEHVPLFRGATTDFNTTFGLAGAVIVIMQYVGVKERGLFGYLGHFIQIKGVIKGFRKSIGEGLIGIVSFFVGLIEIISEIAKILSLSLRLFGNMFAHEVLTVILLGAFSFVVPAIWMGMGLLVGAVQSVVFIALTTVYYSLLLKKDSKEH